MRKRKASEGAGASLISPDANGSSDLSPSKKRIAKDSNSVAGSRESGTSAGSDGKGELSTVQGGGRSPAPATGKPEPSVSATNSLSLLAAYSDGSDSDDS